MQLYMYLLSDRPAGIVMIDMNEHIWVGLTQLVVNY
jgi:hypothetical protein